jgi:hypothetical protein
MDETCTQISRPRDNETNILAHIVDAMLEAQADLQDATVEEWTRALVESCRRQRQRSNGQGGLMVSVC